MLAAQRTEGKVEEAGALLKLVDELNNQIREVRADAATVSQPIKESRQMSVCETVRRLRVCLLGWSCCPLAVANRTPGCSGYGRACVR